MLLLSLKFHSHHMCHLRKTLAADFVQYLKRLESSSVLNSDTIEVPPTMAPAMAVDEVTEENAKKGKDKTPSFPGWDKLVHLTDENYKEMFLLHKHLFILFHAKWCANCAEVKPMFAEMAQTHDTSLATLAACDADLSPNMVDLVMVDSLPTFKYVRDGQPVLNYPGERTAAAIKQFLLTLNTVKKDEL